MIQNKINVINLVVAIVLALASSVYIYASNEQITFCFFIEMLILLAFFCVIIFCSKDRFNPFSFFLLTLFLGVIDIILVVIDVRIVSNKYSINIYEKSLFIIIVWLSSFLLGYFIKIKSRNPKKLKILNTIDLYMKNANIDILLVLGAIIFLWIAFIIVKTIITLGGIDNAINNFAIFRYNNQGYLTTLIPLMSIVTIALWEKKNKKLSIISMIINFILISVTGRRGLAISTVIIPFLVFYNYREKKITNKQIFILLIPLMCFILFIGSLRNQKVNLEEENGMLLNIIARVTNTVQFGQNVPNLLYNMEIGKVDFQGGKYLFNGILGIIPRSIWPDKVEPDHSLITSRLVYGENIDYGRPVGAFGFAYLCFGYFGVVLSGIITGKLTRYLYNWLKTNKSMMTILIYSLIVQSVISITNPESQLKILTLTIILIILVITSNLNQKRKAEKLAYDGENKE